MGVIKTYFKHQFNISMFGLNYENAADFYISCFQKNRSSVPVMIIRAILFLGCLGIFLTSFILTTIHMGVQFFFIYMTQWGIILITLTSGFGLGISTRVFFKGPIDSTFGLPWYIKAYWVIYTITIPIAFFITVFYWIFLANLNEEFAVNDTLDVFIHAINSVLMLILILTSRHPTNLLHFYFPIVFAIVYVIFSAIFYAAGGTDPFGNIYIYPVLDWSNPGPAFVTVAIAAILILILHFTIAILTVCRDAFGRFCRKDNDGFVL